MDPISVLRTLWSRRWLAGPIIVLTIAACGYALFYGPRAYSASASYVLITPGVPTEGEIRDNPALTLEADNPYLRSDPALVGQVVAGRLQNATNVESLREAGLSTDYTVGPGIAGSQQIVTIDVQGGAPDYVLATVARLDTLLGQELADIQMVNGAAGRFLISAQTIGFPDAATERVSSRLRSVIVVGVGGFVILFGVVSVAQALDRRRDQKRSDSVPRSGYIESVPVTPVMPRASRAAHEVQAASSTAAPNVRPQPASDTHDSGQFGTERNGVATTRLPYSSTRRTAAESSSHQKDR